MLVPVRRQLLAVGFVATAAALTVGWRRRADVARSEAAPQAIAGQRGAIAGGGGAAPGPLTDAERHRLLGDIAAEIRVQDATHSVITRRGAAAVLASEAALAATVRLTSETAYGSLAGFRFRFLQPGSVLSLLGFRAGDLVRTVNGIDLTSPELPMQNYRAILDGGVARIGLIRDGHPLTLQVSLE